MQPSTDSDVDIIEKIPPEEEQPTTPTTLKSRKRLTLEFLMFFPRRRTISMGHEPVKVEPYIINPLYVTKEPTLG